MGTLALIGLGSNLGDRKATLEDAVAGLAATQGIELEAVSSFHETAPVGGPGGQGAFLNAVVRVRTTLEPHDLLARLHEVERLAGRVREVRWGARTLDLDLLIYGCKFFDEFGLKVPHPRLGVRRFVLAPAAEIAPSIVDVVAGQSIAGLLANLNRAPRYLAILGPDGMLKDTIYRGLLRSLPAIGLDALHEADPLNTLAARIDRLDTRRWPRVQSVDRWLISDYCLATTNPGPNLSDSERDPGQGPDHRRARYQRWIEVNRQRSRAIHPTFGVFLGGDERPPRAAYAWLRPEASDPEGIIAEVLATCRSIQGG